MAKEDMKWYVLNVLSGKENSAIEHLESEIKGHGLESYINEIVVPKEKFIKIVGGKKIKSERNSFPGYVFVQAEINGEVVRLLKNTPNVIGFLGGAKPTPLRESEVKKFLGKVDELNECDEYIMSDFLIGERVKIIDGPFLDFIGSVDKIDRTKKRLTLEVKIFGRSTPVELGYEQVNRM